MVRKVGFTLGMLLGLAQAAPAATLFTPRMIGQLADVIWCSAVNVSASSRSVSVAILDGAGAPVAAETCGSLASGQGCSVSSTGEVASAVCRVTVAGRRRDVRGAIQAFRGSLGRVYLGFPAE